MESKRQSQEEDKRADQKRSRQNSQLWEILRIRRYLPLIWNEPYLEDFIRNTTREVVELQLPRLTSSIQTEISGGHRFLKLVFRNELPDTIYTMSKLKARDNNPLEVVLFDTKSQSIVSDENDPLSSIKVEICALDGEFGSDGSENWSKDEFKSKILSPRSNKGQLLKGDTVFALKNGVGFIHNEFTDNSSWIRTGRFRLGAIVAKSNMNDALIIKEGISKPFRVRDYRSELNKTKNPSLSDEIWHLKHISKKGKIFEQLSKDGILTVGDFLKEHETNPLSLEEKLSKISSKRQREEIYKQAKKAKHAETGVAETILFEGQNYLSENNTFNSDQMACQSSRSLMQVELINGAPDQDVQRVAQQEESLCRRGIEDWFDELSQNDELDLLIYPLLPPSNNDEAEPDKNRALYSSNKGKSKMM
ncbi:protein SAR DEFICIENT 1 isoform X2 [Vigna radiata var. radiata]|uniref:Protein SAR DEFICIENT 1 isoform X2 n=1 Tax=Vigna radiata var. radiata TaxID=3916 RepID=A0A3Q0ETM4_VIGRR|nr:protein SAR DEFICIENT 1 isoform X2 [Vigna radiata var. radiata]